MTGTDIVQVQYRGAAPALTDLLAGQVQLGFDTMPASIEYIRAGRLRALVVGTLARSEAVPEVPTVNEFVPGYESSGYFGNEGPSEDCATRLDCGTADRCDVYCRHHAAPVAKLARAARCNRSIQSRALAGSGHVDRNLSEGCHGLFDGRFSGSGENSLWHGPHFFEWSHRKRLWKLYPRSAASARSRKIDLSCRYWRLCLL